MTRSTRLSCMTAALLSLAFLLPGCASNAIAQEATETQQASPDVPPPNQQDQPKEEANSQNSSESTAKPAEPDCN